MSELTHPPDDGCYIHGLFLEGARWDPATFQLAESRPKELYTEMAVIWLLPVPNRKPPASGIYLCPIYKTLTRAGKCPSPISRSKEDCSSWEGSPGEAVAKCCAHGHRARHCWMRLIQGEKISPAMVVEMEQTSTLMLQQCLWPGSPQAHTQNHTSLFSPTPAWPVTSHRDEAGSLALLGHQYRTPWSVGSSQGCRTTFVSLPPPLQARCQQRATPPTT